METMEVYRTIMEGAVKNKCDAPQVLNLKIGECTPQGDLYIMRIADLPEKVAIEQRLQLVPGRTMGSRHCLDSLEGITLYGLKNGTALDGVVIESTRVFQILHPEHADKILSPGFYRTGFQRAYAQELRRRMD